MKHEIGILGSIRASFPKEGSGSAIVFYVANETDTTSAFNFAVCMIRHLIAEAEEYKLRHIVGYRKDPDDPSKKIPDRVEIYSPEA